MNIRLPKQSDSSDLKRILKDTELFPPDMLEGMLTPFFENPSGTERWLVCENDAGAAIGFCYYRMEPLTEGTWNLMAIGLLKNTQGHGYGRQLLEHVEEDLSNQRILIVDTSGLDQFESTRQFYLKCGFHQEAVIRDYWATGDDKVIFWKRLNN